MEYPNLLCQWSPETPVRRMYQEWSARAESMKDEVGAASLKEAAADLLSNYLFFLTQCQGGKLPLLELVGPANAAKAQVDKS